VYKWTELMIYYIHLHENGKCFDHTKRKDISELTEGSVWKPFGALTHPPRYKILKRTFDSKIAGDNELWIFEVERLEDEYDAWNGPKRPTKFDKEIGTINKIINGQN